MDVCAGLTPLAVSALALLEERPMHPYEMLHLLRERGRAEVLTIKAGSLYHTMSRLAELGLAQVQATERDGNRPERTVYGLTEKGRRAYVSWVRAHLDAPTSPQEYSVALAEAHNLDAAELAAILVGRRGELTARADSLRARIASARDRGIPEAFYLEHERRLALLDCDIAWTAEALSRLAANDIIWSYQDPRAGQHRAGSHENRTKTA
ncbi:MAG TPA: helix-turn-helix transcriptional regulator [Micromonosporaceae bacterium]|jgi:DNA-binding PadR family transcriptional regulator